MFPFTLGRVNNYVWAGEPTNLYLPSCPVTCKDFYLSTTGSPDGRFLFLLMFARACIHLCVRPSVSSIFTQMTWMDFFDITHIFEVSVEVDAHHFRILKFFKMVAWRPFFLFLMFCALS
jgi:hypothetical protein